MCGKYVVCLARLGLAVFSSPASRSEKVTFFWYSEVVRCYGPGLWYALSPNSRKITFSSLAYHLHLLAPSL